jgi:lysophospholipase L1-like esterase
MRTRLRIALIVLLAALALLGSMLLPPRSQGSTSGSVAIIGDSLSTGYGCGHPYETYAWRLEWYIPGPVTRLARVGASVYDYLPGGRFPELYGTMDRLRELQPGLVIIALGANDYGYFSRTVESYMDGMRQLTNRVREATPSSRILFIHTNGFRMHTASLWESYGRQLDAYSHSLPSSSYLDIAAQLPWYDGSRPDLYYDNVHLTCVGYLAMALAVITEVLAIQNGV